jgi:hypothetical protein
VELPEIKKNYRGIHKQRRNFSLKFSKFFFSLLKVIYRNKMKKKFKAVASVAGPKRQVKTKSSITMMLFLIAFTFAIFMFPDAIMTCMQLGYANENYLVRSIREVTDLLIAVNSSTTFPICYYFSIQYRSMFKETFMTPECKRRRVAKRAGRAQSAVATCATAGPDKNGGLLYEENAIFLTTNNANNTNNTNHAANNRLKSCDDDVSLASSSYGRGENKQLQLTVEKSEATL